MPGLDDGRFLRGLDFSSHRKIVVAVSGGSDSLSLLLLTQSYLAALAPDVALLAVTVDHGLRPEAAAEADAVAALCAKQGIAHRTLVWGGDKPKTGLIAAAREARYGLLADAAQDFGTDIVLTGHTMDDQAETVAMRAQRGEGAGLSGMAAATLFDERVWIVRPLLGVRRDALRGWLMERGVRWIDDPTNDNSDYERVRMRSSLAASGSVEELAARARHAGGVRRRLSDGAADLVRRYACMPSAGLFRVEAALFEEQACPTDAATLAVRAMLAVAGGTPRLPDVERTQDLMRLLGQGPARVALSRAIAERRKDVVWFRREARALPELFATSSSVLWDGRWLIRSTTRHENVRIASLGKQRAVEHAPVLASDPPSLVSAALSLEPGVFDDLDFFAPAGSDAAALKGTFARPVIAPFARFLLDFDLALAAAMAELRHAPPPPASPWKNHIEA